MCISMLFTDADKTEQQDGLPVAYKRKVIFLKRKFRDYPELEALKPEATEIFSQGKTLSKVRNDVIHGYVSHYDPAMPGGVTFTKLAVKLERHVEDAPTYSVEFLIGVGQKCLDLSSRMIKFNLSVEKAVEA